MPHTHVTPGSRRTAAGTSLLYDVISPLPIVDMLLRWLCSNTAGRQEDAAEHLGYLLTMTGMGAELGLRHATAELEHAGALICKTPARAEVSEWAAPVDMHQVVEEAFREQGLQMTPKLWQTCMNKEANLSG